MRWKISVTSLNTELPLSCTLLYGDGSVLRGHLGPWWKVDIPHYPARDGEDDVKVRCDSTCLTQGVAETLRRRYSRWDVWSGGIISWCLCSFGRMKLRPSSMVALWGMTAKSCCMSCSGSRQYSNWWTASFITTQSRQRPPGMTMPGRTSPVTRWRRTERTHQKTHDELTALKNWMQHHYQEEADLELEILQRIWGDVDRLLVHREDRCRHPGNEEEYHRMRWKMSEEQNKGRGTKGTFDQERETRDQCWESESWEWQEYMPGKGRRR